MGRILTAAVALASLLFLLGAPTARAQSGEDAERTAAARALFQEGMRAVDAHDWETAADRLRRSLALRSSPVVAYNLSLALIELGQLVEASEHLRSVQRESGEGSDAHRLASQRLAEVLPRLGRLRIDVTGSPAGTEVRLDDHVVPEALIGAPQPADPGPHRVTLVRRGEQLAMSEVTVASGEEAVVTLYAPPSAELDPDDALPVGGGGVEREWWFWTIIGGVAVAAVVGIVLAVVLTTPGEALPYLPGDSGAVHPTLLEWP